MSLAAPSPHRPLPFLQRLEWSLLGLVCVVELLRSPALLLERLPLLNVVCLVGLALLGLRLPMGRSLGVKLLYSGAELGLIAIAALWGGVTLIVLLIVVFILRNGLLFAPPLRYWTAGAAFILCVLLQFQRVKLLQPLVPPAIAGRLFGLFLSLVLLFGLVLLFLQLWMDAWMADVQLRQKLEVANAQLQQYARQVETMATLEERNRIAREIHDSLGHSLTALNLHLEATAKLWAANQTEAVTYLDQARQLGRQALEEVRQSVSTLRSTVLGGQSFTMAIAPVLDNFQSATGIQPRLDLADLPLPQTVVQVLYRVVQEALTNIAKHAQATTVHISLQADQRHQLHLKVQDNGQGFDPAQNRSGFGLQGMRERTLALGGTLTVTSAPAQGCCIHITLPMP